MKEITLKIPENNFSSFMNLIGQLGYVEISKDVIDVPEHHKKIIIDRLKNLKSEELLDWDKVKNEFILDKLVE